MTATQQARLRRVAAALAVVLLHVLVIRALLGVRALFEQRADERQNTVTTWIILPPESVPASLPKLVPSPAPAAALPMARLIDETASSVAPPRPVILRRLTLPTITLPPLTQPAGLDARVFSALGAHFSCNFVNYDTVPDAEKARCALHLSKLGEVPAQSFAYIDSQETPFTIFGARGIFRLTPPAQSAFEALETATGCKWDQGLCRLPGPAKFGLDPDDPTRSTAAAKFELAKGLTLDVGAQGYMQNYLGGARLIYAAGVVPTYRW